ncbi:hypothetical protein FB45DRAFT_1034630 [Roridomyces roridus]|uniref:Uncharacterized protein n=1 Tax=Roridomyces roridus TaxID=1738132 RepID=A0AAD7FGL1_9AGAR|nr:hypothetical protein FB45DRAFT_1034630 [Roridomyces roridus]
MYFSNLAKLAVLAASLALQVCAALPAPKITVGDFEVVQGKSPVSIVHRRQTPPTVGPFVPTAANLIFNTTVPQGTFADLGWKFNDVGDDSDPAVFDGFAKNISVFYTPPGEEEQFIFGIESGFDPETFCGFFPGDFAEGVLPSNTLGTYKGRWTVEFGTSADPSAPVDPQSGCGPQPFDIQFKEFKRTWEVVPA